MKKEKLEDVNFSTIVENERENQSFIDEADTKSFAPFEDYRKEYPDYLNQDPTRENYNEPIKEYKSKGFPLSGLEETSKALSGAGFTFASSNTMNKYSYLLDMSYDVTDVEKQKADQAILFFDQVVKDMYKACEFLDLMREPFEKDPNITTEQVMDVRSEIRDYRDNILEKFNIFKSTALKCLDIMEIFSKDTQTSKLMKNFISSIEEIEEGVNELMNIFNSLKDPEFVANVIKWTNNIKLLCDNLEDVIYNRIVKHIKSEILSKTWADSM